MRSARFSVSQKRKEENNSIIQYVREAKVLLHGISPRLLHIMRYAKPSELVK